MPSAQCTSHKGTKGLLCPSASLPSPVHSSSALLCFYLKETTAIGHPPIPVWPAPSPVGKVVVSWAGAVEIRAPGGTQVVPTPSLCSSWALLGSAGSGVDLENSGAHCYGPCTPFPFSEGPPLAQPGNLLAWPLALGHGEDWPFLFPQVDTASEVEELEADTVSLLPAAPEGSRGGARIQVFLARYRWASHPAPYPPSMWGGWEEGAWRRQRHLGKMGLVQGSQLNMCS